MRLVAHLLVAVLPWWLKNVVYRRVYKFEIARDVRIGLSPLAVARCRIGPGVRIGHGNLFWRTKELVVGEHVRIHHFNLFRGGDRIEIGRYAEIFRANVMNSIPEPDVETRAVPELRIGAGSVVTTGHWLDFTDTIVLGTRTILGGRNSSLWTHSRQWTRPISIGDFVYLGSEVRLAPGAAIASHCVVALGAVVVDRIDERGWLVAGNPARPVKRLDAKSFRLLLRKTRRDLPDDVGLEPSPAPASTSETPLATEARRG